MLTVVVGIGIFAVPNYVGNARRLL